MVLSHMRQQKVRLSDKAKVTQVPTELSAFVPHPSRILCFTPTPTRSRPGRFIRGETSIAASIVNCVADLQGNGHGREENNSEASVWLAVEEGRKRRIGPSQPPLPLSCMTMSRGKVRYTATLLMDFHDPGIWYLGGAHASYYRIGAQSRLKNSILCNIIKTSLIKDANPCVQIVLI